MMTSRASRSNTRRRWHSLVEYYTPDGALGRLLLGAIAGFVGAFWFYLAIVSVVTSGIFGVVPGLVAASVGVVATLLAVVVLWPVYLSLIGNLESTAAYSRGSGTPPFDRTTDDDDVEDLKRQYVTGDISEAEFDRQVEDRLEDGFALRSRASDRPDADDTGETERT